MSRRNALTRLAALPLMMAAGSSAVAETKLPLKIMMKSAWESDDPTKASFPFLHGHALAEPVGWGAPSCIENCAWAS